MRKWVGVIIGVILVLAGIVGGYEYYQKKINKGMGIAEQWASSRFEVVSELPGLQAQIGNRQELERYLRVLGVWNGFWVDGDEGEEEMIPKRVLIHLTYNEYKETWFVGAGGGHLFSGKAERGEDGETLHIYLGFDQATYGEDTEKLARAADIILFETVYARTGIRKYEQWGVEMRDAKRQTEPFFLLSKNRGAG